jgi:hypothetical protein
MPSTREPIQLLEPADLLEPLDLRDHHTNSVYALAYPEYGATPSDAFARASVRDSAPAPMRRGSRVLRSALLVAGALACFGAGAALSQLPNLPFVDGDGSPTIAGAIPPAPRAADATFKREDPTPAVTPNNAQQGAASSQPSQAAAPSTLQQSAVPPAKESAAPAVPPCNEQAWPNDDTRCLAGATLEPAAATAKPKAASDPITINDPAPTQPIAQPETSAPAEHARADTRASSAKQQRASSLRSGRHATARRDDQRSADNNVPNVRWSSRRQAGDTSRASGDRRDWAANDGRTTAYSTERWQDRDASRRQERDNDRWQDRDTGRWQDRETVRWPDREADRTYGWRRDRYDGYARGDDRSGARVSREDERMTGRAVRQEAQPIFAPFGSGW